MAIPVIQISEFNTSAATETPNITSIAYASVDENSNTSNLSVANPVLAGANAFEKWLRAKVVTAATNSLTNFTVAWPSTNPQDAGGNTGTLTFKFNVNSSFPGGGPTSATSTVATIACIGSSPTTVTAPANTSGAFSGYVVSQAQVGGGAAGGDAVFPGALMTLAYQYS